jgi:DNA uptake protein ComE-like DNA-binding protein
MKRTLDKSGFKNRDSLSLYDEESHADPKKFRIAGTHVFQTKAESFIFDPNTIPEEEWKRLGLSDRVIQTIFHYLGKGGHFHKAEDLKKLYGLKNADYERLFPYVRINKENKERISGIRYAIPLLPEKKEVPKNAEFPEKNTDKSQSGLTHVQKLLQVTDINLADSLTWIQLPGIGPKLASRIIHFREKLGGFFQVEQVGETFGLPDSTFQKIKPVLRAQPVSLILLDLNQADPQSLQSHPYIRWQLAKAIVAYRQQHGGFRNIDELLQLALMDSSKLNRLKPYLTISH